MRVISKSNASSLDFQGVAYEPGPDGVFDFPEPVGVELTTKHASMWVVESVFRAQLEQAQRDSLRDPNVLVGVVADLVGRVSALEEQLAAAEQPKAPKAETPPPVTPVTGDPKAAKAAGAKKTAAKKTAAAKPSAADSGAASIATVTQVATAAQDQALAEQSGDDPAS